MCGRYFFQFDENTSSEWQSQMTQLELFDFRQGEIFPSQKILTLHQGQNDELRPDILVWGMTGYQGRLIINARREGIDQKITFRPWLHQRCAVFANGFYEWTKRGKEKSKIYIRKEKEDVIYLAGIYNDKGECVIVTGAAQDEMAKIHDRTPIIMNECMMRSYLSRQTDFIVDNENLLYQRV